MRHLSKPVFAFVLSALALALAAGGWALAAAGAGGAKSGEAPVFDAPRGEHCVLEAKTMRREHMSVLFRERNASVHEGKRDAERGLAGCIQCHAGETTGSVLGEKGFCESCHRYAAVKIDCFECHSPRLATAIAENKQ